MHLGATEVVDQRVPVLVEAFERVFVFIQGGTVKTRQAMGVGGEMCGHPVQNHADRGLVTGIDEGGEIFRRAITCGRREHRQRLIAPGATKRMFHDRHQLDMGEAHLLDIRHQALRQLAPVVEACHFAGVIQLTLPGPGVQFINRQWRVGCLALATLLHPLLVLPGMGQRTGHP
ncbi:hypothetical protein D3C72_1180810 [compost metagenome]